MRDFVERETIFMTVAGSRMYGTSTPDSDVDRRGVCVPPKNVVMGFARRFEQQQVPGEDTTIFSLMKFMELAVDNNPNIIELLFVPEDCIITIHPTWRRLLEHRHKFLSAKCYHTFTGYAHSQLNRIRGHRDWLRNPPTHKPTREEFGLGQTGLGLKELAKGVDLTEISPETLKVIEAEKRYNAALTRWTQYQKWLSERNPKRAELEKKFGYDSKHASHLIRLYREGYEILTTGNLTVRRPDAAELRAIRNGAWSFDRLMEETDKIKHEMDTLYEQKRYVVPFSAPREQISDLAVELHEYHWSAIK